MSDCAKHRRAAGFSLVEIMVGMTVGLLGILAIMQMFTTSEAAKRATVAGADAQENGLMALFTIERDLRNAGFGVVSLGCPAINVWDSASTATPPSVPLNAYPITIERDAPAAGSDRVTVLYSASAYAGAPASITSGMPLSSSILNLNNASGFFNNNIFVVCQTGLAGTMLQATQDGQKTGSTWNLQHNPGGGNVYNPPGGSNIFPPGGYGAGATVTNMGTMVTRRYYVENNQLMMFNDTPLNVAKGTAPAAGSGTSLVDNIITIRAQYGRAGGGFNNTAPTTNTEVIAARVAVVARSRSRDAAIVTPSPLNLWSGATTTDGGQITLTTEQQHYRYKIYQTIIPFRNVKWAS